MLQPEVISSIKKSFSRSDIAQKFREKFVVKNRKGVRGGKLAVCNICGNDIPLYLCNVDHIQPIVPVMIPAKYMSFIYFYTRTFCDESNLQLICESCHSEKSKIERSERVKWRKKKKFLVCRSVKGSKIEVVPIINMNELEECWEIMDVKTTRKEADEIAKLLRRI